MPEFQCRVATAAGEVFERAYTGVDEGEVRRDLEAQDLLILDVRRRNPMLQQLARALKLKGGVSPAEFLVFNQEFRALIKAGLPIVPSLDILLERRKNKVFRNALIDIRDRVKGGEALSDAFAAQGDLVPRLYPSSLASGERSGELPTVIERYIAYQQKVLAVRRKVISALVYPVVLVVLSMGLIALMVFYIIPKFQTFLVDFGVELPLITRIVVGGSMVATQRWYLIVGAVLGTIIFLATWGKTESGRLALDRFKMRIPLVGGIVRDYAQNRFTRTLGTLQAGGIPLVTSLELSSRAVGNAVYERALVEVAEKVRQGQSLWESLDDMHLLSDITIQMIKVGESTGALDDMLTNASEFTDAEIESKLERTMALVEPIMLVAMAVVVGIMLLSIYYPLIEVYGNATA